MAHAQKPDLVFQRNGRVHLNWRGCQFSRLLAVEECGSADSDCIDRVPTYSARLLATHSIRIFPLHFPSRASPCAIRFWTRYTLPCLPPPPHSLSLYYFYFCWYLLRPSFSLIRNTFCSFVSSFLISVPQLSQRRLSVSLRIALWHWTWHFEPPPMTECKPNNAMR